MYVEFFQLLTIVNSITLHIPDSFPRKSMSTDITQGSIGHSRGIASSPSVADEIITILDSIYCLLTICKAVCKMSAALFPLPLTICEIDTNIILIYR